MSERLTCSEGHEWESPTTATSPPIMACPICGSPASTVIKPVELVPRTKIIRTASPAKMQPAEVIETVVTAPRVAMTPLASPSSQGADLEGDAPALAAADVQDTPVVPPAAPGAAGPLETAAWQSATGRIAPSETPAAEGQETSDNRPAPGGDPHPVLPRVRAGLGGGGSAPETVTYGPSETQTPRRVKKPGLRSVGDHLILEELGRGGMGIVYKARHVKLNRIVALKMILPSVRTEQDQLARFRAEAEAVARLQHPNIVQIYEVGEHEERPYFSLEFVDGGSLGVKLLLKPQPPDEAAQLTEKLARAVHYAHQRGIVHRDLKPANVLLTGDGMPKITDFGLAKQLDDDIGQTQSGQIMGTPCYMAPEQASGDTRQIGPLADVYALGTVLYEMLTGRPPFQAANVLETLQQVKNNEPVPPIRLQPKLPRDLDTICLKCLQKEPRKRYESAEALADDLRRFLDGVPIKARPISAWERTVKWARRRPAAAGLIGVTALALVILVLLGVWYNRRVTFERNLAEKERNLAEKNFERAMQAVDEMLTSVAEEQLAYEPRMEQKRRDLLKKALDFYQQFLQERGDDPRVRKEAGLAYKRMGDVLRMLGRHDEARPAYGQAIALLSELVATVPDEPEHRRSLAETYNWLGESLRKTSSFEEAKDAYQKAAGLQQQLVNERPGELVYQKELARSHYNLGIVWKDTGRPDEARQAYDRAIAILLPLRQRDQAAYGQDLARVYLNLGSLLRATDRGAAETMYTEAITILTALADQFPEKPDYKHALGVTFHNHGNLLFLAGEYPAARGKLEKALELFKKLAADFPKAPDYRKELANTYNTLGAVVYYLKQPEATEQAWEEARRVRERLVAEFKDVTDYRGDLGTTIANLGWLRLQDKKFADARNYLEEGVGHLEAALKPNPGNPAYLSNLSTHYGHLGEALDQTGPKEAAANAYYKAAWFLARSLPAPGSGAPGLSDEERQKVIQVYSEQTTELLRTAVGRGFKDLQAIERDPAFEPLRQTEPFRQLQQEIKGGLAVPSRG